MSQLMDVNTQWATRPADERFTSLGALRAHVAHRAEITIEPVVSVSDLQVRSRARGDCTPPYRVEVQTAGDGAAWTGNGLRFETRELAEVYARDLSSRWAAVTAWQVLDASEVTS